MVFKCLLRKSYWRVSRVNYHRRVLFCDNCIFAQVNNTDAIESSWAVNRVKTELRSGVSRSISASLRMAPESVSEKLDHSSILTLQPPEKTSLHSVAA